MRNNRICNQCGAELKVNMFYSKSYKCKYCIKSNERTVEGVISKIYTTQRTSSKKRGHPMPTYTAEELKNFILSHECFMPMYNGWIDSGFQSKMKPSIDRKKDDKPYTINNIMLVTWGQNDSKAHLHSIQGKLITGKERRGVFKVLKDGTTVCLYNSIALASRDTGVDVSSIIRCCTHRVATAGKFIWRYENV